MSNSLNIGGQIQFVAGGASVRFGLTAAYTQTGSHFINAAATVPTGSWTVLSQGSNANCRYTFFTNTDATSSCFLGINGTGSYSILGPGDSAQCPFSGSAVLYAQASGPHAVVLNYLALEA